MRRFFWVATTASMLWGSTFFNLEGISGYDIVVADTGGIVDKDTLSEMQKAMQASAKRLGIDTSPGHATVLAAVLSPITLEDKTGVRIELELGEYFRRKTTAQEVFALSYVASATLPIEEIQEEGVDTLEELLDSFERQYRADNASAPMQRQRTDRELTHKNFANVMGYITSYRDAHAKARKENKDMLVYVSAAYCPWCRKLEQRILSRRDINDAIRRRFVPVRLESGATHIPKPFAQTPITPTLYIVDPLTERIKARFVGYHEHESFVYMLRSKN